MKISKNKFCKQGRGGLYAVMIAILVCIISQNSKAEEYAGINIQDKGRGSVLVFIPGLNSGSDTFTQTCEAFVKQHRCVLLHLPGFAGQKPVSLQKGFLSPMKDEIISLLREKKLSQVTLVGHSLGGLLSLMIALDAPELVDKIVIVDSLPFFPAIQNPLLTTEQAKPMAEQMRQQMNAQTDADFFKNASMSATGMSNQTSRYTQLIQWGQKSDRATTTLAMYELMTTDLRASVAKINKPVMVLGAWAAYKNYGSTKESTQQIFSTQYAQLKNVDIHMSETGYHFLTWDDNDWVNQHIQNFLKH
jgi:pimeloyl-ACP methyl ester carboxylesterase